MASNYLLCRLKILFFLGLTHTLQVLGVLGV